MGNCYFHQVGCSKCNHKWIIMSNKPIHWSTHVIWLVGVKYEHMKLSAERNDKEE